MLRSALTILFVMATPLAWAAEPVATTSTAITPTATKKIYSNSVQIGLVEKSLKAYTEHAPDDKNVEFTPETPTGLALGWANRILGLSLSGNIATSKHSESRIQTASQDYLIRYFKGNVGVEFIYQDYRGFALSTKNKSHESLVPESQTLQPDLSMRMFQLQWDWAIHGESALEAFGPNWEKPTVDGRAYYITASIAQSEISSPKPFLPQDPDVFGRDIYLTKGLYQTVAVGAGATSVWQWTHFYMALLLGIQAGPQLQQYTTTTASDTNATKLALFPQAKFAMGYDWGAYYVTIIAHTQPVSVELQDTDIGFSTQEVALSLGSRF
jgi:hypothetical protein